MYQIFHINILSMLDTTRIIKKLKVFISILKINNI